MFIGRNRELTAWHNFYELEDGRELKILYTRVTDHATFNDPEESEDSETEFYLDGESVVREELPAEITDEIITKLEANASEDPKYDFGFD